MTELNGATKPTSIEQDEHLTVNGVSVKRVLASGFDGTNLQDIKVDTDGKLEVTTSPITGASTSAKQDDILAELAQKTEPGNNQLVDILPVLRTMVSLLANPPYVDKTANAIRTQVQSGTVTTVTTGTVTTVTTVTGLTNIDSQQGRQLIINDNVNAWANNCRARIS